MATEHTRCQFIDNLTQIECDNWYQYEEGQKFCPYHRSMSEHHQNINREVKEITRIISEDSIQKMNAEILACSKMTIPEIAAHIRNIEEQIKDLERQRRSANVAKRNLEDKLSEEEKATLREVSRAYNPATHENYPQKRYKKTTPEEKAANRKEGFSAWAARLGVTISDLMAMDDDEMANRIAKFKAAKS